jgi:alanyl aminopeptidase
MTLGALELTAGGRAVAVEPDSAPRGVLTLTAREPLPVGPARLSIAFAREFDRRTVGLYRVQADGAWYAFTQFEDEDARLAFPCFDQPEFKIPWAMTIVAPEGQLAVANMPEEGDSAAGDRRVHVFRRSPPMPSYLVALAVGPFDTVPLPGLSVPGRVITVRGQSALTANAVRVTPPLLAGLERWFGRPYPFPKLDLIAVPEFWPGAMENPGLITFADRVLLLDPRGAAMERRRAQASTITHELAHMWFGDLVTMEWWDDLWLNESFATWMGEKVTHETFPEFAMDRKAVRDAHRALVIDGRLSTRAIRQPVLAQDNLLQAADVLAYQKGQAVLGMFERWIGPAKFQQGVRDYLAKHEWGNATAADLWSALSRAAGRDVGGPMGTFLNQPGVPLVRAELLPQGRVRVTQRRMLPAGEAAPGVQLWQVPLVFKVGTPKGVKDVPFLLAAAETTVRVDPAAEWLEPNADAAGYLRWSQPRTRVEELAARAQAVLTPRERIEFVGNARAMVEAGELPGDAYFAVLARFAHDPEPGVVAAALADVNEARLALVEPEALPAYAAWLRGAFGPALERIGPLPRPGETEEVSTLREPLLRTLAFEGRDPRAQAIGDSLGRAYLADPDSVDPALVPVGVAVLADRGDAALYAEYRSRFIGAKDPGMRMVFMGGLGAFSDPALVDSTLDFAIHGPVRPQEVIRFARGMMENRPEQGDQVLDWAMEHDAILRRRIPPQAVGFLPWFAGGCSQERYDRAAAFYGDPARKAAGTEKELARVRQAVEDCRALRRREAARVRAYLEGARP